MGSTKSDVELRAHFLVLLERHVQRLTIRGRRATGLCPFHQEKTPSLSIDLEKGVFHCFGCGVGGGVKRFAELVGEAWTSTHSEARAAKARCARSQAEQQARGILQQRKDSKDDALYTAWCEVNADAADAADLLALFYRRPDLAAEFPDLAAQAEQEYGEAVFMHVIVEAQLDGELK